MKKLSIMLGLMLLVSPVLAANLTLIKPDDLSIKAGPTQPGEELSLAWLESFVYPKSVGADRLVSLGMRTVVPVKSVSAAFDFNKEVVALGSEDGLEWSGSYKIPANIEPGLHIARYSISGQQGSIQRTVEFVVADVSPQIQGDQLQSQGQVEKMQGWMLTVVATSQAVSEDKIITLAPGQGVFGLYKAPWYRVIFEDGKEGWISAAAIKEPVDEFFQLGREAYHRRDYVSAAKWFGNSVAIDNKFAEGYVWLAKSYHNLNDLSAAHQAVIKAMALDERNIEAKVVATTVAQDLFKLGQQKFQAERFNEAVVAYQKVVELKPSSTNTWLALGKTYSRLGFPQEARDSWREALREQPDNKELHALLNIDGGAAVSLASQPVERKIPLKIASSVTPLIADDSLEIVKRVTTKKGTKVETALASVVTLTKSLGTPVQEKGWQISKKGKQFLAQYVVEQGAGVVEAFEWLVDVDAKKAMANNDNARTLMSRW
ncbi:MAG: tetratricopeptide repeat protein [bacterium]